MNCSLTNQSSSRQDFMNLDFKGPSPLTLVELYTDGACSGNPGPGGWAAILTYGQHQKSISGYEENTTNNRMEISAAVEAFKMLSRTCQVELFTDSQYLKNGITTWIYNWRRNIDMIVIFLSFFIIGIKFYIQSK